jgi:hypothetical protein
MNRQRRIGAASGSPWNYKQTKAINKVSADEATGAG